MTVKNSIFFISIVLASSSATVHASTSFSPELVQQLGQYVFLSTTLGSAVAVTTSKGRFAALTASHIIDIKTEAVNGVYSQTIADPNVSKPADMSYTTAEGYKGKGYVFFAPEFSTSEVEGGKKSSNIKPAHDFAVLSMIGKYKQLPRLQMDFAKEEEDVIAIGYLRQLTHAEGIVVPNEVARDWLQTRDFDPHVEVMVLTDSRVGAGMSGGGLFNRQGKLIGITIKSGKLRKTDKSGQPVEMNYIRAVRISYILEQYNPILERLGLEKFKFPALGQLPVTGVCAKRLTGTLPRVISDDHIRKDK